MLLFLQEKLQKVLKLNVIAIGFVSVLDLKILVKEILISLHKLRVAVGKGLNELAN